MALGRSELNNFECDRMDVDLICKQKLRNSWNTFQYVAKNLNAWADETTIGSETRDDLIKIADRLDQLLNNTDNLISITGEFTKRQRKINEGN